MPADKPTELSRIKLKTWTRQPVPMISKHSAHSTLLPIGFRTWLWRYTCLLLLISMLWHRQAIFESKGDKLSSSAEGRIRTQGLRYLFTSRLNACWQTDWAIEDQAKNLNSTARPYDQQAFSPLDLQTEATPPAASCPARTLHATEIAPKNATQMTCPWLHWTTDNLSGMHMVSISTPVCVNFELRQLPIV